MNSGIEIWLEFRIYNSLLLNEGCLGFSLPSITQEKLVCLVNIWLFGSAKPLIYMKPKKSYYELRYRNMAGIQDL